MMFLIDLAVKITHIPKIHLYSLLYNKLQIALKNKNLKVYFYH